MFVKNNQEKRYYNGKIDPLTELKEDDVKVEALPFSLPAPSFPRHCRPRPAISSRHGMPEQIGHDARKSGVTHASRA